VSLTLPVPNGSAQNSPPGSRAYAEFGPPVAAADSGQEASRAGSRPAASSFGRHIL